MPSTKYSRNIEIRWKTIPNVNIKKAWSILEQQK